MPEGEIYYRYGRLEDSNAIAQLGAHVFTVSFAHLMPAADLQKYLLQTYSASNIAADLQSPSNIFVLAIKDEAPVGFMQLARGKSAACIDDIKDKIQLHRLYISEKCQGRGIGKELIARAEREAQRMGIRNIWLAAWELNPRAARIYERAGFVKTGNMEFILGDTKLRDWVMVKTLGRKLEDRDVCVN